MFLLCLETNSKKLKKFGTWENLEVTRLQVQVFPHLLHREPSPGDSDIKVVPIYDNVVWFDRPKFWQTLIKIKIFIFNFICMNPHNHQLCFQNRCYFYLRMCMHSSKLYKSSRLSTVNGWLFQRTFVTANHMLHSEVITMQGCDHLTV